MNIYAMGEYYVWHCDWCDSTNHTLWSRMDADGPCCAACHQNLASGPLKRHYNPMKHNLPSPAGISC